MAGPEQAPGGAPGGEPGAPGAGEGGAPRAEGGPSPRPVLEPPRYGRYVGLLAILILVLITVNTLVTKPNGVSGVPPGTTVPPFAVPLATGDLQGDADVATRAGEGAAGNVPACRERGPRILNVCQLYEQGPVVLALFIDGGSCPQVLSWMQALQPQFPRVRFAAVSIKGATGELRAMIRKRGLTFPVGIDRDGALVALYKVASCPQVSFIAQGGRVQSRALLGPPSEAALRTRVAALAFPGGAG